MDYANKLIEKLQKIFMSIYITTLIIICITMKCSSEISKIIFKKDVDYHFDNLHLFDWLTSR